jgi:uncharacterized membrane protein
LGIDSLLRFLHIVAALAFIGGIFARQLVRGRAGQTDDLRRFATLSEAAGLIETRLIIPGNAAVILIGVIYALRVDAPILGFLTGDTRNWLLAANVLLVLGMLTVPLYFRPTGKHFDAVLSAALEHGSMTLELRRAIHDPLTRAVHLAEIALLLAVVFLMVFRPF